MISISKCLSGFVFFLFSAAALAGTPQISGPASDSDGSYTLDLNQPESPYFLHEIQRRVNYGPWERLTITMGSYSETVSESGTMRYRTRWAQPTSSGWNYSQWSSVITVNVSIASPPSGSPNLSAPSSDDDGDFTVSWSTVGGANQYQLQQSVNGGSSWATVYNASGTSRSFTNKSNGAYAYRVRACNDNGCGPYSSTRTVIVDIPPATEPPATPTNFTFQVNSGVVYWDEVDGAEYYQLQVYDGGWTTYYQGSGTGTTTASHTDFRVRACNSVGCSSWNAYPTQVY